MTFRGLLFFDSVDQHDKRGRFSVLIYLSYVHEEPVNGRFSLYTLFYGPYIISAILLLVWSLLCYRAGVELIHFHYGITSSLRSARCTYNAWLVGSHSALSNYS